MSNKKVHVGMGRNARRKLNRKQKQRLEFMQLLLGIQECGLWLRLKLATKIVFRVDARLVNRMEKKQGRSK